MKKAFVFVFLAINSFVCWSQIDNYKKLLDSPDISDEQVVKIYLQLAEEYWSDQMDSASVYTERAYSMAKKLDSPDLIAQSLVRKSILLINENADQEALELLAQALEISKKNGLKQTQALVYHTKGKAHKTQPDSALYYYQKSIDISDKLGLEDFVIKNKIRISLILLHQKRHQELAELFDEIIPNLENRKDYEGLSEAYTYMSLAFRDLNEEAKAILYGDKALSLTSKTTNKRLKASVFGAIGSGVTGYFESFEKAEPLLNKSLQFAVEINDRILINTTRKRLAILYCNNTEYAKAAPIIDSLLPNTRDPDILRTKGIILYKEGKYNEAETFYDEAYALYEQDKAYIQQRMLLLYMIDNKLARVDDPKLTQYFMRLDTLTTMIYDAENKSQFFDLETKYRTAEKEAEIQRKELALAESKNRVALISGMALLAVGAGSFGIWSMRAKQKRKELEHTNMLFELNHLLNAKELANLNNQLNPHEIKNLITSIAPELITKAPEAYKKMIKLFNVTRASLTDKLTESLAIQLQQADDYLQLRQSISPYPWRFEIINDLSAELNVELPRLLLKNMVENAVKYGMESLKGDGLITIKVSKDDHDLKVEINDNGIGVAEEKDWETTGIGLTTYQKLFNFANVYNQRKASLTLQRKSTLTTAHIVVPLNYKYR